MNRGYIFSFFLFFFGRYAFFSFSPPTLLPPKYVVIFFLMGIERDDVLGHVVAFFFLPSFFCRFFSKRFCKKTKK